MSGHVQADVRGCTGGRSIDIYFFCGSCGQHLVVDEAGAGLVIPCPNCAKDVTVPGQPEPKPTSPPPPATLPRTEKEHTVVLKWAPPAPGPNKEGKS
ncbi:MAG: hypothetical protein ACLPT4_09795 [Verrucomicrobiia bacterium]